MGSQDANTRTRGTSSYDRSVSLHLLAVDPHVGHYAMARYRYGVWTSFSCDKLGAREFVCRDWCTAVLIEDQYLFRNYRSAKELSKAAGVIEGLALGYQMQVFYVNPAKWLAYWKLSGMKRTKARDELVMSYARDVCRMVDNLDEAAAVLIGEYWRCEHGYGEKGDD